MNRLILIILIFCSGFGFVFIPEQSRILSVVPLISAVFTYKYSIREGFAPYIILFYLFLTIGLFSCQYFRGQTPFQTIQTVLWVNLNGILSYFYLKNKNFDTNNIEGLIHKLYLFFCVCYIIQFLIFPFRIFDTQANGGEALRFRMVGQLILSLGFFNQLNKYILHKKKKDLFKLFPGLFVFLLLGFRSMLAALVLSSFVMLFRIRGFSRQSIKNIAIAGCISVPIYFMPITQTIINNMIERQKTDNFDNDDYIRIIQYDYFTNSHFINSWEHFLGSGIPKNGTDYEKSIHYSREEYGSNMYGWVDWGLLGLSWIIGIPAVFCLIIISVIAIFKKVPPDSIYISVWYTFLLLLGLTTIEFFRVGGFIFHGLALYVLEKKARIYKRL